MSDADSFIQEVSEEVRRDRMFRLWRRFAPFVIGAIVAIVAGAAALSWLDHRREQAAREAGGAVLQAADAIDPAQRAQRLLAQADALEDGPAMLALLRAAAALQNTGVASDRVEAMRLYQRVSGMDGVDAVLADFAALRGAALALDAGDLQAADLTLSALTGPEGAFRLLALELRAALHLARGDRDAARADAETIAVDPLATEGMRARIAELLAALGAT